MGTYNNNISIEKRTKYTLINDGNYYFILENERK